MPKPDHHKGSAPAPSLQLSYQATAGDPVPVRTELTLTPEVVGPEALARSLRSENALLAIRKLRIVATGYCVAAASGQQKLSTKIDFDKASVEGNRGSDRFAFDFEKQNIPADLGQIPLKALCWAFSMKAREFTIDRRGQYAITRDDDDSLIEAMSVIYNAPILLPHEPVAPGARWTTNWNGTRRHKDTGALLNYRQTARLEKIERGKLHAFIRAETSAKLDIPADKTTGDQRLEARTAVLLDTKNGQILSSKGSGKITSSYPAAGLEIVWGVEATCDAG
jgi:hypothetical protein